MSDRDEADDPRKGDILAPEHLERDGEGRALLPDIPLLPGKGIVRTAFLHSLRYGSARRAFEAYARAVRAAADAQRAVTELRGAEVEHSRALGRLNDLDLTLEADRDARAEERAQAKLRRLKAERQLMRFLDENSEEIDLGRLEEASRAEEYYTRIFREREKRKTKRDRTKERIDDILNEPSERLGILEALERERRTKIRRVERSSSLSEAERRARVELINRLYNDAIDRLRRDT